MQRIRSFVGGFAVANCNLHGELQRLRTLTPPALISTPWYSANVVYPRCQSVRQQPYVGRTIDRGQGKGANGVGEITSLRDGSKFSHR